MSPNNAPRMNKEKVSLKEGYWFYLTGTEPGTDEPRIVAFGSALTGRETVFVDDEIVSSQRSFSRRSTHQFVHDGHSYEVAFNMESIKTGKLVCRLTKDGQLVTETSKSYATTPFDKKTFLLALAAGALFGFFLARFLLNTAG